MKPLLLVKYLILGILIGFAMYKIIQMDWSGLFMIMQAFLFSLIPTFLKKIYGVRTPHILQAGVAVFMFATIFLGEVGDFYNKFWWWDIAPHILSGIALGLIAYIILIVTYRKQNVSLAPIFTSLFAISFSLGVSAFWEITEFMIDSLLQTNMQPSVSDTMWDLIAGLLGACISAWAGFRYLQYNEKLGLSDIIDEGVRKNK